MPVPNPTPGGGPFNTTDAGLSDFSLAFIAAWDPTDWGLIVPTAVSLTALRTAYVTALALAVDPATRGPVTVGFKNDAKAELVAALRQAVSGVQRAYRLGLANEGDLVEMNVRVPDLIRTAIVAPSSAPGLTFVAAMTDRIDLRLTHMVDGVPTGTRRFPGGSEGCEVQFGRSQEGVHTWHGFVRRKRVNIRLIIGQVEGLEDGTGTRVFRARYIANRGLYGPWSEVVLANVLTE